MKKNLGKLVMLGAVVGLIMSGMTSCVPVDHGDPNRSDVQKARDAGNFDKPWLRQQYRHRH